MGEFLKAVTRTEHAASAADRWQACHMFVGRFVQPEKKKVHERLVALGPNPDPDKVDEIIGNNTWTHFRCESCNTLHERAIAVDNVTEFFYVCEGCIRKSLAMLSAADVPAKGGKEDE